MQVDGCSMLAREQCEHRYWHRPPLRRLLGRRGRAHVLAQPRRDQEDMLDQGGRTSDRVVYRARASVLLRRPAEVRKRLAQFLAVLVTICECKPQRAQLLRGRISFDDTI